MMIRFLTLTFFIFSLNASAVNVTFRINMNGLSGFTTPEVNGTFNGWCGSCNAMSDADGDGIWETTVNIPSGNIQYKFSFDTWSGQENLRSAYCANGAFNRTLTVPNNAVVLDVVCWGLCTDCIEPTEGAWTLSWSDEFLGNSLNLNTWTHELGNHGWGNNEWQNYTNSPNNLIVSGGSLKITARHLGGENYSSARIITNNKFEFQYGKIEARIKVPIGQGIWPAFWMLGANYETVGWPQCGEIDIMEHVNNEPLTHSAMHWNEGGHTYDTGNIPYVTEEFHRYGAIWNEDGVTFTLNDHPYLHFPFLEGNNTADIFRRPFFFLLNVAVGGNWPGYPDGTATFPATMEVQYIRVYEPNTLSISGTRDDLTKIYPLPAKDFVNIEFAYQANARRVYIFNASGQLIGSEIANGEKLVIDAQAWSPGMYILQVWGDKGEVLTHKVVKE